MKPSMALTLFTVFSFLAWSSWALSPASSQTLSPNVSLADEFVNATFSNLTANVWQKCNGEVYGTQINATSCLNAWKKIPRDSGLYMYGSRSDIAAGVRLDVGLPVRFLSDDGLCAIDVGAKRGHGKELRDSAENIEISKAAKVLLDRCVLSTGEGGYFTGFSQANLLALTVKKYESRAVCDDAPRQIPYSQFCERVVQTMPARRQLDVFAFGIDPRPAGRYAVLPKIFDFPKGGVRCSLKISMHNRFPITRASWVDLWAAGFDIYSKCIQHGMSGFIAGLGDNQQLYMSIEGEGGPRILVENCGPSGDCTANTTSLR